MIPLKTKITLNNELKKCTIAVAKTATSIGKNKQKAGSNRVPNPKPEKNVNTLPTKTTRGITTISNYLKFQRKYKFRQQNKLLE